MKKYLLLLVLLSSYVFGSIGSITLLEGSATLERGSQTLDLKLGDSIEKQDIITTAINSKARVTFEDDTIITIGKSSTLNIEDYLYDDTNSKSEFSVPKGAFHAITGAIGKVNPSKFKLKTKNATIGIRGTEIYGDQSQVFCTTGVITVTSADVTREVPSGNFVLVFDNAPPSEVMSIDSPKLDSTKQKLNVNSVIEDSSSSIEEDVMPLDTTAPTTSEPLAMLSEEDSLDSWGEWANEIQDDKNIIAQEDDVVANAASEGYFIAEDNSYATTSEVNSYVQSLLDNTNTTTELSFDGTITTSATAYNNSIYFNFYLGGQSHYVEGGYEYSDANNFYSDGSFSSNDVTANGFSAREADTDTTLTGSWIGDSSSVNGVSGDINMFNSDGASLSGTFEAH